MFVTHSFVAEERPELSPATERRSDLFAAWALAALFSAPAALGLALDCVMPAATAGNEIFSIDHPAMALRPDDPRLRWMFTNTSVRLSEEGDPDARREDAHAQ
jgi:hypothetical protein